MIKKLQNKFFQLHSCCQLIEGFKQSIIYDVQRCEPYYIPNEFKQFLIDCKSKKLESFILSSDNYKNFITEITKNIHYLINNDLGFYLEEDEIDYFPNLNLDYFPHKIIGNTIIHIKDDEVSFFDKAITLLREIEYPNIEIWFNLSRNLDFLINVLNKIEINDFYSYDLHLNIENLSYSTKELVNLITPYFKIKRAYYYNTDYQKTDDDSVHFFVKNPFEYYQNRAVVDVSNFKINISLYTESQKHQTYFNRKLYIGVNGEIKNAPECEEEFRLLQNLKNTEDLKEIISKDEFQRYWYVHKEITDVCQDCEFRHMCIDNRLPYKRKKDEWYHKTECNYNPYIAKWKGEEGYKTLKECGVTSNENEFN